MKIFLGQEELLNLGHVQYLLRTSWILPNYSLLFSLLNINIPAFGIISSLYSLSHILPLSRFLATFLVSFYLVFLFSYSEIQFQLQIWIFADEKICYSFDLPIWNFILFFCLEILVSCSWMSTSVDGCFKRDIFEPWRSKIPRHLLRIKSFPNKFTFLSFPLSFLLNLLSL